MRGPVKTTGGEGSNLALLIRCDSDTGLEAALLHHLAADGLLHTHLPQRSTGVLLRLLGVVRQKAGRENKSECDT